jgi:hypothetical protein
VLVAVYPFVEGIVVEGNITGTDVIHSDGLATQHVHNAYNYPGYSQNDTWATQCAIRAYFAWGISEAPQQNCVSGTAASWTDTIKVMDSVFAKRGPPIVDGTYQCWPNECHTYGPSTQTLTLSPIAADLKYTATPAFRTEAEMTAYYAPYTLFRAAASAREYCKLRDPQAVLG